jgi:hypothetical protein
MAPRLTQSKGSKPDKLARDGFLLALNREVTGSDGKPTKRLYVICEKIAQLAEGGDIQAAKEVFDRVDGKAVQSLDGDLTVRSDLAEVMQMIDGKTRGLPPLANYDRELPSTSH